MIEKGYYPFSEEIEKDLENRQRDLGLKPEDAARISKPILDQAELDYQAKENQLVEAERVQEIEQQQRKQEECEAKLEHHRQEPCEAAQAEHPFNEDDVNEQTRKKITRGSSNADIETTLLIDCPSKASVEAEVPAKTFLNIPAQIPQRKLESQKTLTKDEIVFNLINKLFNVLSSPNAEIGLQDFETIAHKSLLQNGQIDPAFRKNCFNVAITRLNLYKRPIEVIRSEPTGRTKLGLRGDKENGQEEKYTIARKEALGGFEGNIRIFFSASSNSAKISGFSL